MTHQAGTRLGPYEIVSPLGAGGMGEVNHPNITSIHDFGTHDGSPFVVEGLK
jgi:serine/threonine protein kinase